MNDFKKTEGEWRKHVKKRAGREPAGPFPELHRHWTQRVLSLRNSQNCPQGRPAGFGHW